MEFSNLSITLTKNPNLLRNELIKELKENDFLIKFINVAHPKKFNKNNIYKDNIVELLNSDNTTGGGKLIKRKSTLKKLKKPNNFKSRKIKKIVLNKKQSTKPKYKLTVKKSKNVRAFTQKKRS